MTDAEQREIERLTNARTAPARAVERARIIGSAAQGQRVPAIARHLHVSAETVRLWIKRFNADGLDGLVDAPRSGHPLTYSAEQVGEVIAASLTNPTDLGLPFGSWTLDRLEVYLNEDKGVPIKRSRIDELLLAEGLRWRTQEGWFGERAGQEKAPDAANPERDRPVDPEFAPKRPAMRCQELPPVFGKTDRFPTLSVVGDRFSMIRPFDFSIGRPVECLAATQGGRARMFEPPRHRRRPRAVGQPVSTI